MARDNREEKFDEYYSYLQQRSRLCLFYRRFWLYPILNRYLVGKVLDVGCGIGDMLHFRDNITGVDINPVIVDALKKQDQEVHLMKEGILPFEEESFDSVLLDNVLEHILEPQSLLDEIRRVLKPGGTIIVGVPNRLGYDSDSDHKIFYDEEKLVDFLTTQSFATQNIIHAPLKSSFLERRMRQYCLYGVFRKLI